MENDQRAKLDSYQRVQSFDTTYATDLSTIDDYPLLQKDFDSIVSEILDASGEQGAARGVTHDLTDEAKHTMAETVITFASRGSVKAHIKGNDELAGQLDETVSYIYRADKNMAVQRANDLRNLMNENLALLTNISTDNIAAMDETIAAFTSVMNEPVITMQHKKSQGTDSLPGLFTKADTTLDSMFKLVKSYFYKTKSAMVNEMALAMQVINTGIRHTQVNISVIDEAVAPVAGAAAVDKGTDKSYVSDYKGLVHIDRHKSGHDSFTISAKGYQTVTVGMDIKRGTDNKLTVTLAGS